MKHTLLFLLIAVAFCACKSSDKELNPTPDGLLSGYLTAARVLDTDSPATKYSEVASAVFYMHPGDTMKIAVDSVKLNSQRMPMDNITRIYNSQSRPFVDSICLWQAWSTTNISTFSYNFERRYPGYSITLPDTLDLLNGFTLALPSGADSAIVTIRSNQSVAKGFNGNVASFTPAQLTSLSGGTGVLQVDGFAWTDKQFGGKNYRFQKITTRLKSVWLK